jgi:hypothetical protein
VRTLIALWKAARPGGLRLTAISAERDTPSISVCRFIIGSVTAVFTARRTLICHTDG